MYKHKLRFRQVHLDFHTSELVDNIAINFNKEEFVDILIKAHVNSVTCFARSIKEDISIYYNDGSIRPGSTSSIDGYTHLEFDALPSSGTEGYKLMRTLML